MARNPISGKGISEGRGESLVSLLMGVALVTVCSLGLGFLFGTQLTKLVRFDRAEPAVEAPGLAILKDVQVVALPSVVTNLSESEGGWARVELVVLLEGKMPVEADLPARLAQDTAALLRTLSLRQISSASGFQHLREELMDRMNVRSKSPIRDVMIQSLVIE